jgi:ankyrin repeat protein
VCSSDLIDKGWKPLDDVKKGTGDTALHIAACHGCTDIFALLLPLYTNIFIENNLNNTPLHDAAGEGAFPIVILCLQRNDALDALTHCDYRGKTPLHIAAENGFVKIAEALLNKEFSGATTAHAISPPDGPNSTASAQTSSIFITDNEQHTPLSLAAHKFNSIDPNNTYELKKFARSLITIFELIVSKIVADQVYLNLAYGKNKNMIENALNEARKLVDPPSGNGG